MSRTIATILIAVLVLACGAPSGAPDAGLPDAAVPLNPRPWERTYAVAWSCDAACSGAKVALTAYDTIEMREAKEVAVFSSSTGAAPNISGALSVEETGQCGTITGVPQTDRVVICLAVRRAYGWHEPSRWTITATPVR